MGVFEVYNGENMGATDLINSFLAPDSKLSIDPNSIKIVYGTGISDESTFEEKTVSSIAKYDGSLPLDIGAGLILSSGSASPNQANTSPGYSVDLGLDEHDPDFQDTVQKAFSGSGLIYDNTYVEFSFTVTDLNVHGISFDLVFGSDEYPEYTDTSWVDIGAVFLNGENVALFNGQDDQPLSVISKNLDVGNFIDNTDGHIPIEYDGISHKLSIYAPVKPGVNTIKIGVADSGDHILDSSLFISNLKGTYLTGSGIGSVNQYTEGNDNISGSDNNEVFDAGAGDDIIDPGYGNDVILAGDGNDYIYGGKGDNQIDGGDGYDIVYYNYKKEVAYIKPNENGTIKVGENSDTLLNVEQLKFSNGELNADEIIKEGELQKIYIAYFGRAADPEGCQYWENYLENLVNQGKSSDDALQEIVNLFAYSDEAEKYYPGIKTGGLDTNGIHNLLNSVYENLFDRGPDSEGLDYWTNVAMDMQAQNEPLGAIIYEIIKGARDEGTPDRTLIQHKAQAAWYLMKQIELHNDSWSDDFYNLSQDIINGDVDATNDSVNLIYGKILDMFGEV